MLNIWYCITKTITSLDWINCSENKSGNCKSDLHLAICFSFDYIKLICKVHKTAGQTADIYILDRAECVRQSNEVVIKLLLLSVLSTLRRLGRWLADDSKGKPPHWLLGVNSYCSELSASTSLMSYGDGRQT